MHMNKLECSLVQLLKQMKKDYSVVMLKAEFETEASRMNELMRLKEIAQESDVGLVIKIGGPEALSNLYEAMHLGVSGIVAPMVETPYAARKFLQALDKHITPEEKESIEFGINVETKTAHQNLDAIYAEKGINKLKNIVLGRVDMSGSLDLGRDKINGEEMYAVCEDIFTKSKAKGFRCCMGGGISTDSIDFIQRLAKKGILDRYETRKVVFENPKSDRLELHDGILKAVEFELLWLQLKKEYYGRIFKEDDVRIEMLQKRLRNEVTNIDKLCG